MGTQSITRLCGWESKLAEYLESASKLNFAWGENDCVLWVCKWVKIATGQDHSKQLLLPYNTQAGADAVLRSLGFSDVDGLVSSVLKTKPVISAMRGDAVLNPHGCLGICDGRQSYFLMLERGLTGYPTSMCLKAWSV